MVHLAGAGAYAFSYAMQVYMRNLADCDALSVEIEGVVYDLKIVLAGHTHRMGKIPSNGVDCFYLGNWQLPNSYTLRKGLVGKQGGIIADITICDGEILELIHQEVKFD